PGRFADRLAERGDLDLLAGDLALEQAGARQQVHARLRVAVELRRIRPVGAADLDQAVVPGRTDAHIAIAVQCEIARLRAAVAPFAIAAAHDQRREAVDDRLLVQQARRTRAVREQVGG